MAYDASRHANRALRVACGLSSDVGLPMMVVTVAQEEGDRPKSEAVLDEARQLVAPYEDVTAEFSLLVGEEEEAVLIDHVEQSECDLIVMGAYGESRIREWLLGSTTAGVLAHSTRPVLLVR